MPLKNLLKNACFTTEFALKLKKAKQNKCTPGVWNSNGTLRFNHLWNSHADKEKIIMHVQCSIGCIYGIHNRPWKTVSTYICILSHFCNSFLLCVIRKIKSGRSNLLVTWNFYQAVEEAHERIIEAPAPQFFQNRRRNNKKTKTSERRRGSGEGVGQWILYPPTLSLLTPNQARTVGKRSRAS